MDDETLSSLAEIEDLLDEYDDDDNLQILQDYMDYYAEQEGDDDKLPKDAYLAAILSEGQSNDNLYSAAFEDADDMTYYQNLYDEEFGDYDEEYNDLYDEYEDYETYSNALDELLASYEYDDEYEEYDDLYADNADEVDSEYYDYSDYEEDDNVYADLCLC